MKWSSAGKEIRDMTEVASELENMPELVIVSGMSGAGRTEPCMRSRILDIFAWTTCPAPYRESAGLNRHARPTR